MPESEVDEIAAPVYSRFESPKTTILGGAGQVELHLVAQAEDEAAAEARIEALAAELRAVLPGRIFSEDGRELPQVVVELLRERGLTLALAESCTGGLLSARLTDVPGVSAVLERGFVTYSNRAKTEELGVDPASLVERCGAVSEEVAAAMAAGARAAAKTDVGVGITGIAGPDGGTSEKPVGLVYVALAGAAGESRPPQPVSGRPRARALPGDAGRSRDAAPRAAGAASAVSRERAGRDPGLRRAAARGSRARGDGRAAAAARAATRRNPVGAARGDPPHAPLPGSDLGRSGWRGCGLCSRRPPRPARRGRLESPRWARSRSAGAPACSGSESRCRRRCSSCRRPASTPRGSSASSRRRRPFRPHLTLGRWRDRAPHPELPAVDLGTTRLETLVLFESDLRPGGAVYTPLARFALGREAA